MRNHGERYVQLTFYDANAEVKSKAKFTEGKDLKKKD
jgi:hypothetical protein